MDHFGPKMAHPHNSGPAVRIFLNFAQWKGPIRDESNNNGLYQKKLVHDKLAVLDPKMLHPHNSGSALRMKGA